MGRVVVEVMPKPEILDPQGKAISQSLERSGVSGFDVRQGKRFELTIDEEITPQVLEQVKQVARDLLSNPVIEDVVGVHEVTGDAK